MGKTRVAPIKTTTISKLELQAALHASRIKVSIIEEHHKSSFYVERFINCDSMAERI